MTKVLSQFSTRFLHNIYTTISKNCLQNVIKKEFIVE